MPTQPPSPALPWTEGGSGKVERTMAARQSRGEETARRILDAALALYAQEGQAGFTVHAITAKSGASLGSVYHHFKSIDGLAAALYADCMDRLLERLVRALEAARSPRAGVMAFTRAYLAFAETDADAARFIHGAPYGGFLASHAAHIAAAKRPHMDRILGWVRNHAANGALAAIPEPLFEMLVVGPVAEVTRRVLTGAPGIDLTEAARVLPERIWQSVRPSTGTGA